VDCTTWWNGKINVDAAVWKTSNSGAIAAMCRSESGVYLGAFAVVIHGISDPETLEAMACREAFSLALDLQEKKVHIASDCLEVINSLKTDYRGRFSSVTHEIMLTKIDFEAVSFGHEKRRNLHYLKEEHVLFCPPLDTSKSSSFSVSPIPHALNWARPKTNDAKIRQTRFLPPRPFAPFDA
jgi:ribonuclease HI